MTSETSKVVCDLVSCLGLVGDTPLREIVMSPDGEVVSETGTWILDDEAGRLINAAYRAHGTDLPIDYEHHTLGGQYASPDGRALAAGWIKDLQYQPGRGLIAAVEWTVQAIELIRSKAYKYISPVLYVRKEDQRAVVLHSAALTNKPAIPRMAALAAKQPPVRETKTMADEPGNTDGTAASGADIGVLIREIKAALGLEVADDADTLTLLTAIRDKVKKGGGEKKEGEEPSDGSEAVASSAIRQALKVKPDAGENEILVAIGTLAKGSETLAAVNNRLKAAEHELAANRAKGILAPHIAVGKINPNDEADVKVCTALAISDPEAFEHQMKHRPDWSQLPKPGRTTAPPGGPGGGSNAEQTLIANALKEHGGKHADAYVALQTRLIRERTDQGFSKKAARAQCGTLYPVIFGTTG